METTEVIVGEIEAGRAAQVKRQINKLIATTNSNTFDLAYLLHESKTKNFYNGWGFESWSKWAKSLAGLTYTKSYYLVRIIENMKAAGLEREQFEPVGRTKLRMISKLKPDTEYKGTPVSLLIRELTLKAVHMTPEEVQNEVNTILGLTEDESMVWLNIKIKVLARDNVVKPALALAKKHMGSLPPDEEGVAKDPSDGAALEMICANFLADPNFNVPDAATTPDPNQTPTEETDALADAEAPGGDLVDETEIPMQDLLIPSDETIAKIAALGNNLYKK